MSPDFIDALKDAPMAALFAYFLFLSFRQRAITLVTMAEMVDGFLQTLGKCCDDDEGSDAQEPR